MTAPEGYAFSCVGRVRSGHPDAMRHLGDVGCLRFFEDAVTGVRAVEKRR